MPQYVVLSRLTPSGRTSVSQRLAGGSAISAEIDAASGKVVEQYALLGDYDFCTIVELPNNAAAQLIGAAHSGKGGVERYVLPAIDLPLFSRLIEQTTETTGPHRWQISWPARLIRRAVRPIVLTRHGWRYFDPLVIEGTENLRDLRGPAIFIGNHASHLDSVAIIRAIPSRYRDRVYWGSAADRWFLKGRRELYKQGWWRSLAYACFPIQRGGGSGTLSYPEWIIDRGGSIGIFPEGTRTTTGKLGRFRHGTAILALEKNVPVVPIYMDGLHRLRAKGSRETVSGPVRIKVGRPIHFGAGTEVPEATRTLYRAMEALRRDLRAIRHEEQRARAEASPPSDRAA